MFWASVSLALTGAVASASAAGCGQSAPGDLGKRLDGKVDGSDRTFIYWLPDNYDSNKETPMIFSFHGAGGTADQQADLDLLTDPEFNTDHILVYGESAKGEDLLWDVSPEAAGKFDDVGYVKQIYSQLLDTLCIDVTRVYATGMSQGGGLTNELACDQDASKIFAAFAPVSGSYYYDTTHGKCDTKNVSVPCSPNRQKIPMLEFHGKSDDVVWIDGGERRGGCLPDVETWVKDWAERDGLDRKYTSKEDITKDATKYVYGSGDDEGLVTWIYDGKDVGHVWPSDEDGEDTASFNASSIIMDFFKKYDYPDATKNGYPTSTSTPAPSETPDSGAAGLAGLGALEITVISLASALLLL